MATPVNTSGLFTVTNVGSGTTSTLNAGFTFTAGNAAIFECSHWDQNTVDLASVTIGGTAASLIVKAANGAWRSQQWLATNITGGTTDVVVVFGTGSAINYLSGGVQEFAAADSIAYDAGTANTASGTGTAPSVSTATTTSQADTIVVATVAPGTSNSSSGISGPTNWAVAWTEQDDSGHVAGRGAYAEETSAGTKTATFAQTVSGSWAASIAAYTVATSGTQTLTPSLVTNAQTFYAPVVGRGAVTLSPAVVTSSQTFYASVVSVGYTLLPSLLTNAQTFYGLTATSSATLIPTLVTGTQTFFAPTITAGAVTLAPSLVTNGQTFYAPIVSLASGAQTLLPSLVSNAQTLYGATVTADYAFSPTLFTNGQVFPAASVSARAVLSPALLANTQSFYAAVVNSGAITLPPPLVTNEQVFYAPSVLQQTDVDLLPGLFTNEQSFFSPTVAFVQQTQSQFGGWFASAPVPARTRKERDAERRRLGILPPEAAPIHIPITSTEAKQLSQSDRAAASRAAREILERFAPTQTQPVEVVALPSADAEPTMPPIELASEIQPLLAATQKQRVFEQDLVYIVATLLS